MRLAMTVAWWMYWRQYPVLRAALAGGFLRHWVTLAHACLARNRASGRHPVNWAEFRVLFQRDPANMDRIMRGQHSYREGITPLVGLEFCWVLGISASQLYPETDKFLAAGTRRLLAEF